MENIRSFRDLKVWHKAMDAAMRVYQLSKGWPPDERYSLTDQVRRSSRSVAANVSEAWRKRRYPAAFVSKLNDAEGEGAETQTHLEIAKRCGYLSISDHQSLDAEYEAILGMLTNMAAHPEQWTIRPARQGRESRRQDDAGNS